MLTVGIGAVAAVLLADLGGGVRRTLAENVRSVVAAERVGRALDAAASARRSGDGRAEAAAHRAFRSALDQARDAAFLPEEPALLDSLGRAHSAYRARASPTGRVDALRARLLALNERAAEERAEQTAAAEAARRFLLLAVACAAVASVVAGALLARRISRPLRELTAGVAGVGPGRFGTRVDDTAGGEVGALAAAFNGLAERLEAYEALNLRALVREKRTAESLVAAIPSPVVVTDGADGRVRLVNAAAERALGGAALVGRPLAEAAPALAAARADGPEPLVDLGEGYLVTVRPCPLAEVSQTLARVEAPGSRVEARVGAVAHALLDAVVDGYPAALDAFADEVDAVEDQMSKGAGNGCSSACSG